MAPTNGSPPITESKSTQSTAGKNSSAAKKGTKTHIELAAQNGDEASLHAEAQRSGASFAYLSLAAETLEDIERVRIAAENRRRAL